MLVVSLFGSEEQTSRMKKNLKDNCNVVLCCDLSEKKNIDKIQGIVVEKEPIFIFADDFQRGLFFEIFDQDDIEGKFLVYSDFGDTLLEEPLQKKVFEDTNVLLIGMSHSQCGINESNYDAFRIFKMSSPSMDIFLHMKYATKFALLYPKIACNIKTVILEIPYYIFNYDLSLFGDFTKTKLIYFETINDYHHYGERENQIECIENFKNYYEVFQGQEKDVEEKKKKLIETLKGFPRHYLTNWRIIRNKDNVWRRRYPDTINENQILFEKLIKSIRENYPSAKIKILVMPFNPVFIISHKSCIQEMKELFYQHLKSYEDIEVIDDFNYFYSSWNFNDHCHMNSRGIRKYAKRFEQYLF